MVRFDSDHPVMNPGERIGRYVIEASLGEGGMGTVYRAYDATLRRRVALKVLRSGAPQDQARRVLREARAAAALQHPNAAAVFDVGEEGGHAFIAMELVDGAPLRTRIADRTVTLAQKLSWLRGAARALAAAHERGLVHRDVKPENIILSKSGGKIADFGIARIPDSTLTHAGGLMGTPAYSAPETFQAGAFSAESDQFSLAASMYEALSGNRAFPGDDAIAVASKIATDPPARFAEVVGLSPAVDDAFARAMAKKPEDRFSSCEAFGVAVERCVMRTASLPQVEIEEVALPPVKMKVNPAAPDDERKTGRILLGAAAVVATVVLVLRALSQGASGRPGDAGLSPDGSASAQASAQASSSASHKPRAPLAPPSRGSKPKVDVDPAASVEAPPADPPDAGGDSGPSVVDGSVSDGGALSPSVGPSATAAATHDAGGTPGTANDAGASPAKAP